MRIVNQKLKIIIRIFGCQILMLVFGISVTLPTQRNMFLMVGANILSAALYFFLMYTFMYADGQKDAVKAVKPTLSQAKKTGFVIMITANLINILLLLVFTAGQLLRQFSASSEILDSFVAVTDTIFHLLYGVFMGFSILLNPEGSTNPLVYTLYVIISIAVGYIGYYNGIRGFNILDKLGLASDAKNDNIKK